MSLYDDNGSFSWNKYFLMCLKWAIVLFIATIVIGAAFVSAIIQDCHRILG